MATKIKQTEIDAECLAVLRGLYSRYTGQQIADCVAVIRREIEAAKLQAEIEQQIVELTAKLSK